MAIETVIADAGGKVVLNKHGSVETVYLPKGDEALPDHVLIEALTGVPERRIPFPAIFEFSPMKVVRSLLHGTRVLGDSFRELVR
jgi:hypothetical protein